jgi:hypothetical protein
MVWVQVAQDRIEWRAILNTVINLLVILNAGSISATISFSRTLLYGDGVLVVSK